MTYHHLDATMMANQMSSFNSYPQGVIIQYQKGNNIALELKKCKTILLIVILFFLPTLYNNNPVGKN